MLTFADVEFTKALIPNQIKDLQKKRKYRYRTLLHHLDKFVAASGGSCFKAKIFT